MDTRTSEISDWVLACLQKALGHELPNQLVAAQGLLQLLETEEGHCLEPEGRDYLGRARAALKRSHGLVAALADVVRATRSLEGAQPLIVAEVVQEIEAEVKRTFADRAIAFQSDILLPVLNAPPRAFRQVLSLVVRHAIQLSSDRDPRAMLRVAPGPSGAELRLTVSGAALSRESQERLFEPFAEGPGDATARLGLVLARALVERWGGSLGLQPAEEGGNAVFLRIPRAEGAI
jgi:signal transduction histidine kinase